MAASRTAAIALDLLAAACFLLAVFGISALGGAQLLPLGLLFLTVAHLLGYHLPNAVVA
jgi:hypothetical protein